MRILWIGNYTSQSSYANQARLVVPRLIDYGHQVAVVEIGAEINTPRQVGGVLILPTFYDRVGNDCIAVHAKRFNAHAVITCFDTWAADENVYKHLNWIAWTPVDHIPLPPLVSQRIQHAKIIAPMSRFGVDVVKEALPDASIHYIPCSYDPSVWHPIDYTVRLAPNQAFPQLPDNAFLVTFVGVNDSIPSRKSIPEILAAWKLFSSRHDDVYLYLHTHPLGNLSISPTGGVDVLRIIQTLRINPSTIIMPDPYDYSTGIPQSRLRQIAHSTDVLISPSKGEGFGLVPLEFQACGVPTIVNNFSAQPELCFDGWLVDGEMTWTWQNATWQTPGIASILDALENAYAERNTERAIQRRLNVARRALSYTIDNVFSRYWIPAISKIAELALTIPSNHRLDSHHQRPSSIDLFHSANNANHPFSADYPSPHQSSKGHHETYRT